MNPELIINPKTATATEWYSALVADGWEHEPLYTGESEETAAKLTRDGWVAQIYRRAKETEHTAIWAPDSLAVVLPPTYSWEALQAALNICGFCGETVPKVVRLSFAGRACPTCRKRLLSKYEFRGWCD